ncbi:MAG: metalloregulator ArsR/SmtB family transcription factor [Azoarcus sp.]|jgi:ArsR family transcriptional regulator|nr:metalloregulator ArsR/SmtB family transcription factor [Azoarcus sp.]
MSDSSSAPSFDKQTLRAHAQQACALLKTLANEDRLLLLCMLVDTQKNVSELESLTGITQPTLSQQLGVLRREKMVETQKVGKHVFYQIQDEHATDILRTLYGIFCAQEPPAQ